MQVVVEYDERAGTLPWQSPRRKKSMKSSRINRVVRFVAVFSLAVGLSFSGLSGCGPISLPPIPLSFTIVTGAEVLAANAESGSVDVPLTVFCDLFSEERLNELLTAAGGAEVANLVDIPSVELESLDIMSTLGSFSSFTMADLTMTLVTPNSTPIDLGTVTSANGLGDSFTIMQSPPFDLLNDLSDDECGVPTLHLEGAAPAEDIQFNVVANVVVYAQVNLGQ